MLLATKYDIGQELYQVIVRGTEEILCECCGRIKIKPKEYNVDPYAYSIIAIKYNGFWTEYETYDFTVLESNIDKENGKCGNCIWISYPVD